MAKSPIPPSLLSSSASLISGKPPVLNSDGASASDKIPPEAPEQKPEEKVVAFAPRVLFMSTADEPRQFDVCGIVGIRDSTGKRVVWKVPPNLADRFSQHSHVKSGRIARVPPGLAGV